MGKTAAVSRRHLSKMGEDQNQLCGELPWESGQRFSATRAALLHPPNIILNILSISFFLFSESLFLGVKK